MKPPTQSNLLQSAASDKSMSAYRKAKVKLQQLGTIRNNIRSVVFMALGILSAGFGL